MLVATLGEIDLVLHTATHDSIAMGDSQCKIISVQWALDLTILFNFFYSTKSGVGDTFSTHYYFLLLSTNQIWDHKKNK